MTSARQVEQNNAVVAQDIDALEAIETALQQGNLPPEISMKQDLGGMRARLRLIQMINREAAAQA
jgi:vanillate O-demethylase monooxygenase subunit